MKFRRTMIFVMFSFLLPGVTFSEDVGIDGLWTGKYKHVQPMRIKRTINEATMSSIGQTPPFWEEEPIKGWSGPTMDMEYRFKADGNVLTGTTLGGENGEHIPIYNGKIKGRKISFTVVANLEGQPTFFDYTGELKGDTLKLKFVMRDATHSSGSFTVNRVKW